MILTFVYFTKEKEQKKYKSKKKKQNDPILRLSDDTHLYYQRQRSCWNAAQEKDRRKQWGKRREEKTEAFIDIIT